ncbi:MAG: SDR family oxidoreductase [Pleurocapsa minor GSE-CHR-MK-17-07R]|jgi:NAD(P)-dependent dehydrogenase (short-subunit alcohol dehydrogenase family)|nr:SDR family oxidoreductase [Pleurocapsa minor GSE-CHR-MK 17-07R]
MTSKTVFITGASSGIGAEAVRIFAEKGWNVAATMRRVTPGLFGDLPNVRVFTLDVTDFDAVDQVAKATIRAFGRIDVVVNNAGYAQYGPLELTSMEQIEAQYRTNVFGVMKVMKAFIPHFRENGGGTFVNVASLSARIAFPVFGVYSSSKWAVAGISEAMNIELAPFGIRVRTVLPGTHASNIFTKMDPAKEGDASVYAPYVRNFLSAHKDGVVNHPSRAAQTIYDAATSDAWVFERTAGRDASFLLTMRRWLSTRQWYRMQVNGLLRPPSPSSLRFLSWVTRGTARVETVSDPRLEGQVST